MDKKLLDASLHESDEWKQRCIALEVLQLFLNDKLPQVMVATSDVAFKETIEKVKKEAVLASLARWDTINASAHADEMEVENEGPADPPRPPEPTDERFSDEEEYSETEWGGEEEYYDPQHDELSDSAS